MAAFGIDDIEGRLAFGQLFQLSDNWPALPALLYRIHRCSDEDLSAIEHFLATYGPTLVPPSAACPSRQGSNASLLTVTYSEQSLDELAWPSEAAVSIEFLIDLGRLKPWEGDREPSEERPVDTRRGREHDAHRAPGTESDETGRGQGAPRGRV